MSVRELVREMQAEILKGDLQPRRAAELLMRLTALLGNCAQEIREADATYANVLLALLKSHDKANRARIEAETTPAYARRQEARDTKELIVELARSLKYLLRAASEEMQLTR